MAFMDVVRLKNYKTYLHDGKSSITYGMDNKKNVIVAVICGVEPAVITEDKQMLDVENIIIEVAKGITEARAEKAEAQKKAEAQLKQLKETKPAKKKR